MKKTCNVDKCNNEVVDNDPNATLCQPSVECGEFRKGETTAEEIGELFKDVTPVGNDGFDQFKAALEDIQSYGVDNIGCPFMRYSECIFREYLGKNTWDKDGEPDPLFIDKLCKEAGLSSVDFDLDHDPDQCVAEFYFIGMPGMTIIGKKGSC